MVLSKSGKIPELVRNSMREERGNDSRVACNCAEYYSNKGQYHFAKYFPVPTWIGFKLKVYILELSGDSFICKSADAADHAGYGDSLELAKVDFIRWVQYAIKEGRGGIYKGVSSDRFYMENIKQFTVYVEEEELKVTSLTLDYVTLFA